MNKKEIHSSNFIANHSIDNISYFGTNVILYVMIAYKRQIQELEFQIEQANHNLLLSKMMDLMQKQVIVKKGLNTLCSLLKKTSCKPPITNMRFCDWFFVGETVVCMSVQNEDNFVTPVLAIVQSMKDFSDDTCNLIVKVKNQSDFLQKKGCKVGVYNLTSPYIIKQWEYNYVIRDLQFTKQWLLMSRVTDVDIKLFMNIFHI